jgi:hypothetical protein
VGPLLFTWPVMSVADRVVRIRMPLGTVGPSGFIELDPDHSRASWSADSRRLLVRDMDGNLFLVSADGGERRQLVLAQGNAVRFARSWSPSANTVAVTDRAKGRTRIIETR